MNSNKNQKILEWAHYIVDNSATVRATAKEFNAAKSTVHLHVTTTLEDLDDQLFYEVRNVLDTNKRERHIRGGRSTSKKYRYLRYALTDAI